MVIALCVRRGKRVSELVTCAVACGLSAGGCPRSGVRRRLGVETALPEANSFLSQCQPFCNIAGRYLAGTVMLVTRVTFVIAQAIPEGRSDGGGTGEEHGRAKPGMRRGDEV